MTEIEKTPGPPTQPESTAHLVKAAQRIIEAAARPKAAVESKGKEKPNQDASDIQKKKRDAREIARGLQNPRTAVEFEGKLHALPKRSISLEAAKTRLAESAASPAGQEVLGWLGVSPSDTIHNPDAIGLATRIASMPKELQEDPFVLLAEGAKLFWHTDWADLSKEAHDQTFSILRKLQTRIEQIRPLNREFNDQSTGILKETVGYALRPEMRMGMARRSSGPIKGDFSYVEMFKGLDFTGFPQAMENRLNKLKSIASGRNAALREGDVLNAIDDLKRAKNKPGVNLTGPQEQLLVTIEERFEERRAEIRAAIDRNEYIPNQLYLDPRIAERGFRDPIGVAEEFTNDALVQILHGNENSPLAKKAIQQLEQLQYILFSEAFDERRLGMFYPDGTPFTEKHRKAILNLRKAFDALSKPQKELFARSFLIRFKTAQWLGVWKDAPSLSDKHYQEYVNTRMDEDDFFGLDAQYGALVGRFRRALRRNYIKYVRDEHRQRRGMDPKWWDTACGDTLSEMQKNKRNEMRYGRYRNGEFFKTRQGSTTEEATLRPLTPLKDEEIAEEYKEACEAILELSKMRMIMSFEKANLDAEFAPPLFAQQQGAVASDFLEKQKLLRLSHPYENNFLQWTTLGLTKTEIERANIRHRAEIWLETMPEARQFGKEWTNELWDRIDLWKARRLSPDEEKVLLGQIDGFFSFTPDPLRRPPNAVHASEEMKEWLKGLDKNKLQKEMEIYTGMLLSQRFDINPYFMMFESGYRRDSMNKFLGDALTVMDQVQPLPGGVTRKKEEIFSAGVLVGAATSYNGALVSGVGLGTKDHKTGNIMGAKERLLDKIAPIAHSRPHDLVTALKDGHSTSLRSQERRLLGIGHAPTDPDPSEAMRVLSSNFDELHDELLERGFHTQIDYHQGIAGLDPVQKEVAEQWFLEKFHDKADQAMKWHFESMQRMSKYLLGEGPEATLGETKSSFNPLTFILFGIRGDTVKHYGALYEFTNPGYIPILTKARWDDYPYEWLQEPERILGMLDPDRSKNLADSLFQRVSDKFIGANAGDEQSGPFRRMHRDGGNAQGALDNEGDTMDPDEKKHIEATHKKNGFIVSYQGADAAEMSTDVASGARIRTQLVFKSYSPFLEGVRGSCEANRYGFPTVKAISADEANQSLLKDREATYGVSMNVPRVGKLIESVTVKAGVSNWRRNLRVLGYVPVVGQTLRAMEWKLGPAKWNRFVEALDERLPTGVLTLKAALTSPYILAVLGIVAFSELKSGGAGDKNK